MSEQDLTKERVLNMKPYELDRYVHELLFNGDDLSDFEYKGNNSYVKETYERITWRIVPTYSTNMSLAWRVEEQIKELGLRVQYTVALKSVVLNSGEYVGMFDYIHATPEQRCKSALLAVLNKITLLSKVTLT